MSAKLQPKSEAFDKRTAILRSTLHLLASHGFHGFSMKQLADHTGVAAGTIYLYFKDREELIRQLHEEIVREVAQQVFVNHDPAAALSDQYRLICHNFWRFCLEKPDILFSKAQFDHLPPDVLRSQHNTARNVFRPLLDLFDRGRRQGLIKDLPDEVLTSLGIEPYCSLARKYHLGLLKVSEVRLQRMIDASWDAISMQR